MKIDFMAGLSKPRVEGDVGLAVGQSWLNADGFIVTLVERRADGRFKCDMDGNVNGTLNRTYSVDARGRAVNSGARKMAAFDLVERTHRVYIAGPMTGIADLNFPAFNAAAKEYRRKDCLVLNPAEIVPDPSTSWSECMRKDIAALVTCDMIVMLPGWENSKGAKLEHHIAEQIGLTITYKEE